MSKTIILNKLSGVIKPIQISIGLAHHAILEKSGRLWIGGSNSYGQLGLGHRQKPAKGIVCVRPESNKRADNIIGVRCTRNSTIFWTVDGDIFGAGCNEHDQFGPNISAIYIPDFQLLGHFPKLLKVICAIDYTIIVLNNGEIIVWGGRETRLNTITTENSDEYDVEIIV